jgi:hypothetical protein
MGTLWDTVRSKNTQKVLVGVTVQVDDTTTWATTGGEGRFSVIMPIVSAKARAGCVRYRTQVQFNLVGASDTSDEVRFELREENKNLSEVRVKANRAIAAVTTVEIPPSIQRLTAEKIKMKSNGNYAVWGLCQTLPGAEGQGAACLCDPAPAYPDLLLARNAATTELATIAECLLRPDGSNGVSEVPRAHRPFVMSAIGFVVDYQLF